MAVDDVATDTRVLSGWSRTNRVRGEVLSTPDVEVIARAVSRAADDAADGRGGGVIARGLGRSYNESGQNRAGLTVDMTPLNRIHRIDGDELVADVDAGVSLDALMRAALPLGLWLPVLPGTRQVTVGGAIAHDIHGKSHHSTGSFGDQVVDLDLLLADGSVRTLAPGGTPDDPGGELYWATVAGLGLTGIVLRARLRLQRTETAYFLADGVVTGDVDETVSLHRDGWGEAADYSAGWFDAVSRGRGLGRGYFTRGRLATLDELPAKLRRSPLAFDAPRLFTVPDIFPSGLGNRLTFGLMSAGYARTGSDFTGKVLNITDFLHPLDFMGEWNRFYGRRGFLQYQFVVPPSQLDDFAPLLEAVAASPHASFVNVLKMFGEGNRAPLSFPMPGMTATFDFAIRRGLDRLIADLDRRVLDMGGRLYTAKDSCLSAHSFRLMYPRVDEWIAVRRSVDPAGVFVSDMAKRLDLV
ncbi:FAD-binding oxidoreductase [Tsukamurella sp. 8F]|uniref:FAD-binding oxidoreductase n=1 Tax=unclassified Tsukamurella TaxID=2633480 RepID=UPI0023BA0D63|nr:MULTISPECIES: FAD-binding oxidoreductase [unclassified Tsukamurella]MDF0529979.1 FAD-binding oxidoreductase [Tsukamurella sp. 8J]MDF0587249.1 FAD-binding oxidoreductase [Tsukamurella sp. 8F]